MRNNNNLAFTLAEVLITMGIIGIVAEMTIPDLVNNVNTTVQRTTFKKFYSAISQLTMNPDFQTSFVLTSDTTVINSFSSFFRASKTGVGKTNFGMASVLCYNSSATCESWGDRPALQTADGVTINYWGYTNYSAPCISDAGFSKTTCGEFVVDVNSGFKGPNMEGYDIYYLYLYKDSDGNLKVAPVGIDGIPCLPNGTDWTTNEGCARDVLMGKLK